MTCSGIRFEVRCNSQMSRVLRTGSRMPMNWYDGDLEMAGILSVCLFSSPEISIPRPKIIPLLAVCTACLIPAFARQDLRSSRFGLNGFRNWAHVVPALRDHSKLPRACMWSLLRPGNVLAILRTSLRLCAAYHDCLSCLLGRAAGDHLSGVLFPPVQLAVYSLRRKRRGKSAAALCVRPYSFQKTGVAVIGSFFASLLWTDDLSGEQVAPGLFRIEHALYGNSSVFTLGIGYYFNAPDFLTCRIMMHRRD